MGERPTDLGPSSQRQDPQGVLRVGMFARGKLNWLLERTRAPRFLRFEIIAVAERREGKNTLQFVFTIATKKRLRKKFNLKIRFNPFPSVSFNSTRFDSPPLTRDAYAANPLETPRCNYGGNRSITERRTRARRRGAKDTSGIKLSQSPRGEIKSGARRANRINPEKEQLATPGRWLNASTNEVGKRAQSKSIQTSLPWKPMLLHGSFPR